MAAKIEPTNFNFNFEQRSNEWAWSIYHPYDSRLLQSGREATKAQANVAVILACREEAKRLNSDD